MRGMSDRVSFGRCAIALERGAIAFCLGEAINFWGRSDRVLGEAIILGLGGDRVLFGRGDRFFLGDAIAFGGKGRSVYDRYKSPCCV